MIIGATQSVAANDRSRPDLQCVSVQRDVSSMGERSAQPQRRRERDRRLSQKTPLGHVSAPQVKPHAADQRSNDMQLRSMQKQNCTTPMCTQTNQMFGCPRLRTATHNSPDSSPSCRKPNDSDEK